MARKNYTDEQKAEILKKAEETSVSEASKEYGVARKTISEWKSSAENTKKTTRSSALKGKVAEKKETAAKKKENAETKDENTAETRKTRTGRKVKDAVTAVAEKGCEESSNDYQFHAFVEAG